jgi:hypothetical protein
MVDDSDAAQQAAQQAANRRLNETILDLPKFYGTSKDTITPDNLIECIHASIDALAWTPGMAYDYFRMSLHAYPKLIKINLPCFLISL